MKSIIDFKADSMEELVKMIWTYFKVYPFVEYSCTIFSPTDLKFHIEYERLNPDFSYPGNLIIYCAFWGKGKEWGDRRGMLIDKIEKNFLNKKIYHEDLYVDPCRGEIKDLYVCYGYGSNIHMIKCQEAANRILTISPIGARSNANIEVVTTLSYP